MMQLNSGDTAPRSANYKVVSPDGQVIGNMQNMLYDSAAFILFIIPLIVLYLFTQKGFVQSIERSGLVG